MPPKRKTTTRRKRPLGLTKAQLATLRRQYMMAGGAQTGMGFGDWIKGAARSVYNVGKKVYNTGKKVHDWVRDNKAISKVAGVAGELGVPGASAFAARADSLGYGRRQRGGAVMGSTVNARRVMRV